MFSIVKQKASEFFDKNKDPILAYENAVTQKAKRTFFMFLITHYL